MDTDLIRGAIAQLEYAANTISNLWAKSAKDYEFVERLRGSARYAREQLEEIKSAAEHQRLYRPEVLSTDICHNTGISGGCGPGCEAYVPGSECDGG